MGGFAETAVSGCRHPCSGLTGLPRVRGTCCPASGGEWNPHRPDRRPPVPGPPGNDDFTPGGADSPPDGEAHRPAGKSFQAEADLEGRIGPPGESSKGRNDRGFCPIVKCWLTGRSPIEPVRLPGGAMTHGREKGPRIETQRKEREIQQKAGGTQWMME